MVVLRSLPHDSSMLFTAPHPSENYTLSLHDALPIWPVRGQPLRRRRRHRLLPDHLGRVEALEGLRRHRGAVGAERVLDEGDRKSTRLNSSHVSISYAVFCLKKKMTYIRFRARVLCIL